MNTALVEQIIHAVLYEGYILYPYRPSSKKNCRERFTFGRVYPESYSRDQNGAEPWIMQTQCLVRSADPAATINLSIRFLQPLRRDLGEVAPGTEWEVGAEPPFRLVPELRVGDQFFQSWLEAVERQVDTPTLRLGLLTEECQQFGFAFQPMRKLEPIRDLGGVVGVELRHQPAVEGTLEVGAELTDSGLFKVTCRILNQTSLPATLDGECDQVLLHTFASTHTVLQARGGDFVSLLDPPAEYKCAAESCKNLGTWPVLVGNAQARDHDAMLSSPIILYDYPQIAPESPGSLFDGTEIDEILTLRILTMTDEEKREARNADALARQLLERTEALPADALLKMHGTLRSPEPAATPIEFDDFFGPNVPLKQVAVGRILVKPGDRVRIRPRARADIMDMALEGRTALVEAIEQDLEHRVHLALVLESDPGKDLGMLRQPGHRFFYGLDEVEPLTEQAA